MEKIYRDDEVLELTQETYFIHDASVTRFDISLQDSRLCIDVYFTAIESKGWAKTQIKIRFVDDVLEYSFYWSLDHQFYNVERYKLFKTDNGYYISLDPANEADLASEEDKDFIFSKSIEAGLIDDLCG